MAVRDRCSTGSVRPVTVSHNFATVWAGLSDEERQRLRDRVAADAQPYKDETGALELPGSSLAAVASA